MISDISNQRASSTMQDPLFSRTSRQFLHIGQQDSRIFCSPLARYALACIVGPHCKCDIADNLNMITARTTRERRGASTSNWSN